MTDQPWNLKTTDEREEETVNLFVIFCEDKVSEPEYFNSFASDTLRISARGDQRAGYHNVGATVKSCVEAGYMEFSIDGYRLKNMVTENLWCVYDRDLENQDLTQIDHQDNVEWDLAIQTATRSGLKVAWSNDAFELWVLLHFENILPAQAQHRNYIYERLTDIFKNLEPGTAALKVFTAHQKFNYKGAFKKKSSFEEFVLPELKGRTAMAIERATTLAAAYGEDTAYHERNPCTMVFQLVQDLLTNGGK